MNTYSIPDSVFERLQKLEEHKNRQIDENRKISKRVDELENKLQNSYEENQLCSSAVNKRKKIGLSFEEALNLIKQGKLVKRLNWRNIHLELIKGSNEVAKIDNLSMCIIKILKLEDYLANDWEVIE